MINKIQTSTFNLSDKQRESFKRSRKLIDDNHPVMIERRKKFEEMLANKIREDYDNVNNERPSE